ncbi:hypothetical protein HJC23_005997 [Cyclotella cryptica]|uniref:Transmembrane protein n=1 Tax=Cyclotella cryptica TaxID=29204 RepID=A0ABD3NUU9_9STRA
MIPSPLSPSALLLLLLLISTVLTTCTALSVTLAPIVISLRLSDTFTTTSTSLSWTSIDYTTMATAAKRYIDDHRLLESALGLNDNGSLHYDGIRFVATAAAVEGGRFLRGMAAFDDHVLLRGTVRFTTTAADVSSGMDGVVLPSTEELTDIVTTLFQNGETLFVKTLVSQANADDGDGGGSEWMTQVTGCHVVRGSTTTTSSNHNENVVSQAQSSNTIQTQSTSIPQIYGINLFLLIGAAGAVVSFLLLLGGLCYAKRIHGHGDNEKSTNHSQTTTTAANSPSSLHLYDDDDDIDADNDDDDESNADFLMARAALNNSHSAIQISRTRSGGNASVVSGAHSSSYGDDNLSYAFSVEGESVLGGGTVSSKATAAMMMGGGGGGDVAIGAGGISAFRGENGGVFRWNEDGTKMVYIPAPSNDDNNNDNHNVKTQNGFIYDEEKKKWVLAQKNVSFQSNKFDDGDTSSFLTPPRRMQRVRTDDSAVTGFTEFSYDDVAIGMHGEIMRVPTTPQEEGVEVMADDSQHDDVSEFVPNTNVERFIMDDESTMFGSVLEDGLTDSDTVTLPPPPPPPPLPPLPKSSLVRPVSPDESMISMRTEEPGIIQRVPSIHEDQPFDEDIPFDERPKGQSSKTMVERMGWDSTKRSVLTADDRSESEGSADSARVLNDLNKLSKFMMERKRSSKGSMSRSNSGSSHPRSR